MHMRICTLATTLCLVGLLACDGAAGGFAPPGQSDLGFSDSSPLPEGIYLGGIACRISYLIEGVLAFQQDYTGDASFVINSMGLPLVEGEPIGDGTTDVTSIGDTTFVVTTTAVVPASNGLVAYSTIDATITLDDGSDVDFSGEASTTYVVEGIGSISTLELGSLAGDHEGTDVTMLSDCIGFFQRG